MTDLKKAKRLLGEAHEALDFYKNGRILDITATLKIEQAILLLENMEEGAAVRKIPHEPCLFCDNWYRKRCAGPPSQIPCPFYEEIVPPNKHCTKWHPPHERNFLGNDVIMPGWWETNYEMEDPPAEEPKKTLPNICLTCSRHCKKGKYTCMDYAKAHICSTCGEPIMDGDQYYSAGPEVGKIYHHPRCSPAEKPVDIVGENPDRVIGSGTKPTAEEPEKCPNCGGTSFWQPVPKPSWKRCNDCGYEVPYAVDMLGIINARLKSFGRGAR